MTEEEKETADANLSIEHIEHCVDDLRQGLMCSANITPVPWRWIEDNNASKAVSDLVHTCRDWNKIAEWARERTIKTFDPKIHIMDELEEH